jgi:outer membrane receptor for ferrienterochelin and colicin
MVRSLNIFLFLFVLSTVSLAQELDSLLSMSAFTEESELQKQLNLATKVASGKALTTRETPGILSVITAEEIENSGARDLTDVLRLIPGFDIGQDLYMVQGLSFRGNWANEGKVLVLVDGQAFNELLYQTTALGNRFPIGLIEKIEIIRGPGSAIYGGSAEYGVINIITKAASSLSGVVVTATGGFLNDATGRTNAGVSVARKSGDLKWDISFHKGKGVVTNQDFRDLTTNTLIGTKRNSPADPQNINLGLAYKNTSLRVMFDEFENGDPSTFVSTKNIFTQLKHEAKVTDRLTIIPEVKYLNQVPWTYGDRATGVNVYRVRAERWQIGATVVFDPTRKFNLTAGVLYFEDKGTDLIGTRYNNTSTINLYNYALFAQSLIKHRLANVTLGLRYEKNNRFGHAFVPRLALTKKIENFHFKVLYSEAFRAPSIENISTAQGGSINPEISQVIEGEVGYQFTPEMLLSVNAFSINTDNVIIYIPVPDPSDATTTIDSYKNYDRSGSKGVELQYSYRRGKSYLNFGYSLSVANSNSSVDKYAVPQTNAQFVGQLRDKITLSGSWAVGGNFSVNPSLIVGGKRYAFTDLKVIGQDVNGDDIKEPSATELPAYALANLFLNCKNFTVKGLTLGAGVYDLFDQRPPVPQMYNGGGSGTYAPIPLRSREFVVRIIYQLNFKK